MIGRRAFVSWLSWLGAATASACHAEARKSPASPESARIPKPATVPAKPIARGVELLDWKLPTEMGSEKRCMVLVPKPIAPGEKLPLLIALHGQGESYDPLSGASGWPKRYALEKTMPRLYDAPIAGDVFGGYVTPERLLEVNAKLEKRPFRGVIVACPYMPKDIGSATIPFELYATWLGERLLPKIRAELPVIGTSKSTGIDGVSLGGWCALRVGLHRPDLFGAIGTLQPSIADASMVEWATALIADKIAGRPLRIVTSTEDYFRQANTLLDQRLTAKGIAHEFLLTPGPHDYPWNQGAGGAEMLLWHDEILRA